MTARVRLVVTGRVQGVWFRGAMQDAARRLGVSGWVRNRRDGAVEAEAEGERGAVEALVTWAHHGPPAAQVDGVTVEWTAPDGAGGGFVVRRG
jgi:acylphosphatase